MEAEGSEFQDWEVLHHTSEAEEVLLIADRVELEESSDFVGGMIQTNYFSLDSKKYIVSDASEGSSKTSWIDPDFETQYPRKLSGEAWSDSSSDRSDGKRFNEFEGKYDVGFAQNDKNGNFQEFEGKLDVGFVQKDQNGNFEEFEGKLDVGFVENDQNGKFREGVDEVDHVIDENDESFSSDSSGINSGEMIVEGVEESDELSVKEDAISGEESSVRDASEEKGETEVSKIEEKRKKSGVVWWKFPIELLRYCVFRGPVWTVSVAAAFMGFVILGRRLYKMKKKSRALGPRITMDDKKISQFMSRAARLNEAFSVVKRVPIIRPSLPAAARLNEAFSVVKRVPIIRPSLPAAAGVTPWPVMSLR